jgi:hypothetical protein
MPDAARSITPARTFLWEKWSSSLLLEARRWILHSSVHHRRCQGMCTLDLQQRLPAVVVAVPVPVLSSRAAPNAPAMCGIPHSKAHTAALRGLGSDNLPFPIAQEKIRYVIISCSKIFAQVKVDSDLTMCFSDTVGDFTEECGEEEGR